MKKNSSPRLTLRIRSGVKAGGVKQNHNEILLSARRGPVGLDTRTVHRRP